MTGSGIAVPEEFIHPDITHERTRRALVEGVLPDGQGGMGFTRLSASRMVTAVDLVDEGDDPGALDPHTKPAPWSSGIC